VICSATSSSNHLAADYEALRGGALEPELSGGQFGLVILLREGLAAWVAHATSRPVAITPPASSERPTAAPVVSDDIRTDMIAVLASMVRLDPEEHYA